LATLSQTAPFADGPINGRVLQLEVIPEPSTWTLLALAAALLTLLAKKIKEGGTAVPAISIYLKLVFLSRLI